MNFINNLSIYKNFKQHTLNKKIHFSGVGVHNGRAVSMSVEPAKINTGIIFKRTDIPNKNTIKAVIDNTFDSSLCTKIKNKHGVTISTIEHLMAALSALSIDNALIKINNSELPALDGSSYEYIKKMIKVGINIQNASKSYIKVLKKIRVNDGKRYIAISPSCKSTINVSIDYPDTIIGNSKFYYSHSRDNFINYLSEARTYAFFEDVEKMRTAGLAMGGNLNNALVVDKFKVLNPEGLRFEKEFVKHKTLDCVGDFYLLGMQLIGEVECFAPGHKLNQMFIKEILKDTNNYTIEKAMITEDPQNIYNVLDKNSSTYNITNVA
ncbi:UDP-3-O-acyl-N-acetylglucosamine deacetylase [Alphaproteobacteria bacterium]|nr:UDP-3-O-acyl-N-acetylglucosamine deacetylase [Alphaproteobacteria bacterium]